MESANINSNNSLSGGLKSGGKFAFLKLSNLGKIFGKKEVSVHQNEVPTNQNQIDQNTQPLATNQIQQPADAMVTVASETKDIQSKKTLPRIPVKKIVTLLIFLILLIGLVYLASKYVSTQNDREELVTSPTPTYTPTQSKKPSIYAQDEALLKLEEKIKVLDAEISSARIEESTLKPPRLDFLIEFE